MITEFKPGHWYKWIGPKERHSQWNSEGLMDFLLDGSVQCEKTRLRGNGFCASFVGKNPGIYEDGLWFFSKDILCLFIECPNDFD